MAERNLYYPRLKLFEVGLVPTKVGTVSKMTLNGVLNKPSECDIPLILVMAHYPYRSIPKEARASGNEITNIPFYYLTISLCSP